MSAQEPDAGAGRLSGRILECVRSDVERSGERVLWESPDTGRSGKRLAPGDYHGYARWQATHVSGIALLLFIVALLMLLDVGFFGWWVLLMLAGGVLGSLLGRGARGRAIEDIGARRYLLTDERLIMVGADSFLELALDDIQWVLKQQHRDGRGTVVCIYDGGPPGGKIAIEDIGDYEEVHRLICHHAPTLLRHPWQTLLPDKYARRLRQR